MPDDQSPQPEGAAEAAGSAASPTPSASYVTQDQLNEFGRQALDRIAEIVGAAAADRGTRAPAPSAAPTPTIDLEALNQKFRDGDPNAATELLRAAEIIADRKVAQVRQTEVVPLRDAGSAALEALAKDNIFKSDPIAKRYEKEVMAEMKNVGPEWRGNMDVWKNAAQLVKGRHFEELQREAVEQAVRAETAREPRSAPAAGAFLDEARTKPVPTPEQFLGENTRELMSHLGVRTADELARRQGHENWAAYVKFAMEYDTERQFDLEPGDNPNHPKNVYKNSPKGVRRSHARI